MAAKLNVNLTKCYFPGGEGERTQGGYRIFLGRGGGVWLVCSGCPPSNISIWVLEHNIFVAPELLAMPQSRKVETAMRHCFKSVCLFIAIRFTFSSFYKNKRGWGGGG